MTQTTQTIFQNFQVRKTKKQKTAFIEYVKILANNMGYACNVEKNIFFGTRNIIIGNPDTAKVVYTAHYDTCARVPFPNFITPKCKSLYVLYQFAIAILFALVPAFLILILGSQLGVMLGGDEALSVYISGNIAYIYAILFAVLLMAGPANKHTANDNTSGVTTLIDIMAAMPAEKRNEVAFVFFDLEEAGLLGSMAFSMKHRKAMKNKLLINFDCVSDGNNILFAVKRKAKKYIDGLEKAFEDNGAFNVEIKTRGIFYPSDQMNFPCGVGVAALKKSKLLNILYMDRIHTKRDVIYCEENIRFLVDGSVKLVYYI